MTALAFELPQQLEAHEPPEARGLRRDEVRLMVARRGDGSIVHTRFDELPAFLAPGDLVVVNTSATLPAALPAERADGLALELHLSTPAPQGADGHWVVELRLGASLFRGARVGDLLKLPRGGRAELLAPCDRDGRAEPGRPSPSRRDGARERPWARASVRDSGGTRLWLAALRLPDPLEAYLRRHGQPIRYGYVDRAWPLEAYQTAYALEPGSAEMPSAGRPLTAELVTRLAAGGVLVAPVTLHTGVSSPEAHEPPYPERYRVPAETARLVNAVHGWGGRVIAVGTTVVRALESVAARGGGVEPGAGWTNLVVTPERGLWTVDGLLSGWHEPRASHLQLLRAAAGDELLDRCYLAAIRHGYLWHEFGDSHLILP